jgi:hypothetical protein
MNIIHGIHNWYIHMQEKQNQEHANEKYASLIEPDDEIYGVPC